jgi:putative RNA 2'-phosphotransferase
MTVVAADGGGELWMRARCPWSSSGIRRRGRRYVHLSGTVATARKVGARHGRPAVRRSDAHRMAVANDPFLHVGQGTWRTDVVRPDYLETAA